MKYFPIFLQVHSKRVVVCGGGELAHRKALILARTEADLIIYADEINADLQEMIDNGQARQETSDVNGVFKDAALVLIGTGDAARDLELREEAKAAGAVVNVVDRPELCDAIFPSIVDRSPLVIAVGTEGASPILARRVRARIDLQIPQDMGKTARRSGALRGAVKQAFSFYERRQFWEWALKNELMLDESISDEEASTRLITDYKALETHKSDTVISIIGAPHGLHDLLTLRAVQRLQDADVILFDDNVEQEYIDLARRDAEFRPVSKLRTDDARMSYLFAESTGYRRTAYLTTGPVDATVSTAREQVSAQGLKLVISDLS